MRGPVRVLPSDETALEWSVRVQPYLRSNPACRPRTYAWYGSEAGDAQLVVLVPLVAVLPFWRSRLRRMVSNPPGGEVEVFPSQPSSSLRHAPVMKASQTGGEGQLDG